MQTLWEVFRSKGYSRREFLKSATLLMATMGLSPILLNQLVRAMETKPKPYVIWLEFQDCAGCTESFIRTTSILPTDVLLDYISLDYHETLMAPSGTKAELSKEEVIKTQKGRYILVVEGAITPKDGGVYCTVSGKANTELLREAAENAGLVIAVGSCASWGGVPGAYPNPTGAVSVSQYLGKKVVNVPGCPPIGDVMLAVITEFALMGRAPATDSMGRPVAFYGNTIHDKCYRRPFYNAGKFASSFDDEGAKKGYCLYKLGCKGPITRSPCSTVRWNGGLSFPIQSGHPCFGCTEPGFWDRSMYKALSVVEGGWSHTKTAVAVGLGALAGAGLAYLNKRNKGGK